MEPVYYWVCGSCFAVGIVVGLALAWLSSERSEKYIKRMIDHGSANIHTIMQQMMNTRIKQEETLLASDQRWCEERQKETREFNAQQIGRYEELREQEKREAKEVKEITYNLPLPPESLSNNFCPEDHMLELRKGIREYKLNYDTLLPWFRNAMMAGYSHGKNIAIIASKKKGGKK